MSTENNQGRWEFDENGNVHYVPSGEEDQTPVDGSYRISSRKSQPVSENPYWKNINRSNQRSAKADDGWHWILIILGFVGAWPIGLFLLLLQISGKWPSSKKLNMEAGRAMDAMRNGAQQIRNQAVEDIFVKLHSLENDRLCLPHIAVDHPEVLLGPPIGKNKCRSSRHKNRRHNRKNHIHKQCLLKEAGRAFKPVRQDTPDHISPLCLLKILSRSV